LIATVSMPRRFRVPQRALVWSSEEFQFGDEGRLAEAKQRSQHLPGLVRVVVNGLLAHQDETRLLAEVNRRENFCDRQRIKVFRNRISNARSAPMARPTRSCSTHSSPPILVTTISTSLSCSLIRSASSSAMASNG
jgi:hypothetical protein